MNDESAPSLKAAYQVLARKYRPATFDELVGQETVVRTLTNAIASGRLAQAYMLTGVRGTGKTTTARLIARALNCIGEDGTGGPTASPCGVCEHCRSIAEDRHVDVLEMDAASRTGVDDIRELLDGVRYRPTSARTKIYIIDEIHMLSNQAFNALLKTLEEPPEHVKFIFATTEIRKVPVTVLSRCQRFDLRRISAEHLSGLFKEVADKEGATIADDALVLISRAADGSARDGLSILDQAISQSSAGDDAPSVDEAQVRDMLGLADRVQVFDLLDAVMRGNVKSGLDLLANQYASGADPLVVLQDLLELAHWLTRLKVAPDGADDALVAEAERTRGKDMAATLSMPVLTRTWQILLKGLGEARTAPMPLQAVEMTLVRLAYSADLPTPEEAVKAIESQGGAATTSPCPASSSPNKVPAVHATASVTPSGSAAAVSATLPDPPPETLPVVTAKAPQTQTPALESLTDVVALCEAQRQATLAGQLTHTVHLVRFETGRIEIRPKEGTPQEVAGKLGAFLKEETGERWVVSISNEPGEATLHEQEIAKASADPFVKSILESFPGSTIERVRAIKDQE
ncbi:MAG: DNA polymerase III subunit gamma/tau [Rhodospirillaceae bacterium]|nr:DNA polymerase III subunit gamma/tau [Rhodospirillaceae bacterium]